MKSEPTLAVGKILKSHGVRGEVVVLVLSEVRERFDPGSVLHLEEGTGLAVEGSKSHNGRLIVKFEGVADREGAEALRGRLLVVPESELPRLPDGSYWPHELLGCEVTTESGQRLGHLAEVLRTPGDDLWAAREGGRETLIPARREFIVSVDVRGRRIVVRDVPGLTDPD